MKKQLTLTALCLLTFAGGSWLAAQQDGDVRVTRASDSLPEVAEQPAASAGTITGRPDQTTAEKRRPSAAAGIRTTNRSGQKPGPATGESFLRTESVWYPQEAARYEAARYLVENGQRMTPEDAARMRSFQDAIRTLREAENDEDKTVAREKVAKLVSEQLDADLASREKELAAIEQRAKELRKQLDERKTAKPELLKMLVMLIDNPQVGLGIPPEWMQMLMRGQPGRDTRVGFPAIINGWEDSAAYPMDRAIVAPDLLRHRNLPRRRGFQFCQGTQIHQRLPQRAQDTNTQLRIDYKL